MFHDPFMHSLDCTEMLNEEENWYALPLHESSEEILHDSKSSDLHYGFHVMAAECEVESICHSLGEGECNEFPLSCDTWHSCLEEKTVSVFPDPVFSLFSQQTKQQDQAAGFIEAWSTVGCGSSSDSDSDSVDNKFEFYGRVLPSTRGKPAGKKQVQSQWTAEEHERFLEALEKYGSQSTRQSTDSGRVFVGLGNGVAKQIAAYVKTRSVLQVRSHAQKFFLKQSRKSCKV